jgi:dihydroorotate dehydrogenase electron transfer subunit
VRTQAPFGRRRLTVVDRREYGAYVVLHAADPRGPRPTPGQFYMLAAARRWGGGEAERPFLPRAFSFLRATPGGGLHFLLEEVGPGTRRLAELEPGEELWAAGPFGVGFTRPEDECRAVLCGGGVGIAPLAAWQDELGLESMVLLGFRDARHAAGAAVVSEARVATDDGAVGHHGPVTDLLAGELAAGAGPTVYACGPAAMLEAVRAMCAERGVPGQLALEAGMACGFGACFGCVVPTRSGYVRLCLDGPVLEAAELELVA